MRTIVYVDGFNLYYRLLKSNPKFKWLNLKVLAEQVLSAENVVVAVNYYTARVSARVKEDAPRHQQIYLDALETEPSISSFFGNFQVNKTYAHLCPHLGTNGKPIFRPWPDVVRIVKTEEKGSDVNLGSHLIRDAFQNKFDVAAVITNDTDLVEPIRIVTQEVMKPVGILSPVANTSSGLKNVASFVRHIRDTHLNNAQFPSPLVRPGLESLVKPEDWI